MQNLLIRSLVCLLMALLVSACGSKGDAPLFFESNRKSAEADAPVKDVPSDIIAAQKAFSTVSKKVNPSVVNISTISKKKIVRPFLEISPFFEEFFGGPQVRRDRSLGSGFIISRDGYIVTNDHVVRDAESIQVKLSNEKVYDARIIGGDRKTDIAVIKINAGDLPVAVLGNSDKIEVGQWAIAIGNPFGLDHTMTVGIISATGRSNVGIETYENFIQTDASINPGNSGGPLLNVYGEVIGINTAIVASGQGIGFAIPVNMAKPVFTQLISKGSVSRGWIGVSIQPVTDDLAQSFGLKQARGALVNGVAKAGPAEKGGIRQGDVISAVNGTEIKDPAHLQRVVAEIPIGKSGKFTVYRDGRVVELSVVPLNADNAVSPAVSPKREDGRRSAPDLLGMAVEDLEGAGVVVAGVVRGGLAAEAGLQRGDIIVSINRRRISNTAEYHSVLSKSSGGRLIILARRGDASVYFAIKMR